MKMRCVLLIGVLLASASSVLAADAAENVMVIAVAEQSSATAMGSNVYYSKRFRLNVVNTGKQEIDLLDGCFVGYDENLRRYYVDRLDKAIAEAHLAEGRSIKGNIVFSSDNRQVQAIQFVRFEGVCD